MSLERNEPAVIVAERYVAVNRGDVKTELFAHTHTETVLLKTV
jgi:hypothetical protein